MAIKIQRKSMCTGCNACTQICPKECVVMQVDKEGFWYPCVEESKCIKCKLCENVCPAIENTTKNNPVNVALVAYAREDAIRMESSSGGVFSLLSDVVIKKDGIVYGAALDEDYKVRHISVSTLNEIDRLRGSKYVQSLIGTCYAECKEVLDTGRMVLFSGTPCQINGLKRFLQKPYDNLISVDILCHGVPSPLLWEQYLLDVRNKLGQEITKVSFRSKEKYGWKTFAMKIVASSREYIQKHNSDLYMQLFLGNICLRPSCHECKFKDLERISDITLGDAWGVDKVMPDMDDNKGTSIIFIHTKRGETLFEQVKEQLIYREVNADELVPPSSESRRSAKPHRNRQKFFKMLNNGASIGELEGLLKPRLANRIVRKIKRFVK